MYCRSDSIRTMKNKKKFRVLVTGGPVHAHIDAVKIVTNNFKGGRMADLASKLHETGRLLGLSSDDLVNDYLDVTYLCSKGSTLPRNEVVVDMENFDSEEHILPGVRVIYHNGFDDYREKVVELSKMMDAVILGAAVANLIPKDPIKGKFPSHNYSEGETINIPFVIAPRVINEVRKASPKTTLIGFKLLKGVPHDELIGAAEEILEASGAACVLANDRDDLDTKYVVTKERKEFVVYKEDLADFVYDLVTDEYYRTELSNTIGPTEKDIQRASFLYEKIKDKLVSVSGGHLFGTVAVRSGAAKMSFVTTTRDKGNSDELWTFVDGVDHKNRIVSAGPHKPTLNAPLLHHIFETNPDVVAIAHWHGDDEVDEVYAYAPPGTVRDSIRDIHSSFKIEGHGIFDLIRVSDFFGEKDE